MIVQEMAQDVYTVIGKRLIKGVLLSVPNEFISEKMDFGKVHRGHIVKL